MTAEVAIMNTKGIALAADSAVTLGGSGKIYNSADKLFALSKYHPVGIMIYGSGRVMDIDWETIIKSYRDFLGNKFFDKLTDYEGDFINYLVKFPYYTEDQKLDYFKSRCSEVFSNVMNWFLDDIHVEFDGKEDIELSQIENAFDTTLKNIKEKITGWDDEKHIKLDVDFIDSNRKAIDEVTDYFFEDFHLTENQKNELISILKIESQKCGWVEDYSGIVIAGFGEREIFPAVCEFKISGILGNSLIYFGRHIRQIGGDLISSICPFSQVDIVYQFAKGIAPDFYTAILEKVDKILTSLTPLMNDPDGNKTDAITKLLTEYIDNFMDINYKDPILDIVSGMQKNELVSMAEAMVNLTALKRHVSDDEESVGGPIDVALITKGDGFIWIKKKTNYDPQLNRGLNQNYFRSGRNENL